MSTNPNLHTATYVITALAEAGLRDAIICPGSRSTPLTLAAHLHPNITTKSIIDERSAGFFALGLAMKKNAPVALICTSGTALANFYPAIIEANMSRHPLIILSADRPPELRNSGANQTIDQIDIYGKHVLWSVDMPLPEPKPSQLAIRSLITTAQRAYSIANGFSDTNDNSNLRKGAVHLNFPFRKPLQPTQLPTIIPPEQESLIQKLMIPAEPKQKISNAPSSSQLETITTAINRSPHGLIVCGPRTPQGDLPQAIQQLAETTGFALFADPLSGCHRLESAISGYEKWLCEAWWQKQPTPNVVIRFGDVPIGKQLNAYLNAITPTYRFHIKGDGVYADDTHRTTHFWAVDEVAVCSAISEKQKEKRKNKLSTPQTSLTTPSTKLRAGFHLPLNTDLAFVQALLQNLPDHSTLFVGNSLPIRHVDLLGDLLKPTVSVYGSRGASGIDGVISTAGGVSCDSDGLTVLLIGDVSALHDLSGLLAIRDHAPNLCIVILNNDGGYIFKRLPIAKHDPPFRELFITAHGVSFGHAADMFGLDYVDAKRPEQLVSNLRARTIIEIKTDGDEDFAAYQAYVSKIRSKFR